LGGQGCVSRLGWAKKILEFDPQPNEHNVREIKPALTSEFPTAATRPLYSPIDCALFEDVFGICLPSWELSLQLAMDLFV
jgi:dTDP-4-dehydrorhamnose reductase